MFLFIGLNINNGLQLTSKGFQWHIVQTKLIYKNQTYQQKSMFTASGGLTDVPFVVLVHSVGVVGQ
jgi:hypothetical protein